MGAGLRASPKEDLTVMALVTLSAGGSCRKPRFPDIRVTFGKFLLCSLGPMLLSTSVSLAIKKEAYLLVGVRLK